MHGRTNMMLKHYYHISHHKHGAVTLKKFSKVSVTMSKVVLAIISKKWLHRRVEVCVQQRLPALRRPRLPRRAQLGQLRCRGDHRRLGMDGVARRRCGPPSRSSPSARSPPGDPQQPRPARPRSRLTTLPQKKKKKDLSDTYTPCK